MPIYKARVAPAYVRPADWLVLPAPASDQINILAAVFPGGDNYAALNVTATGGYTVDWGDGTTANIASGVTAYHQYSYSGIIQTPTSRGYKQSVVMVTTQVGGNHITAFDVSSKHTGFGSANPGSSPWLDIAVNTPSATSITFRATVPANIMEICTIVACGAVTSLNSAWNGCTSLRSVTFPAGFGAGINNVGYAWYGCSSLQSVTFPAGFGAGITSMSNTWYGCSSLQSVTFPAGFGAGITSMDSLWQGCSSLQSVTFPAGFGAGITSMSNTWYGCSSLQSVTFPAGFGAGITSMNNTWYGCSSLQSVEGLSVPIGFLLSGAALGAAALNLVYTALPAVSSATLTVSTNYGYSASNPSIAASKNWNIN
jgi:hypothetical protein